MEPQSPQVNQSSSPQPSTEQPAATPVMDVTPPRQEAQLHQPPAEEESPEQPTKPHDAPKQNKPPKPPKNGVGMAIFATVVIVLGLAALATYAYIKTSR